MLTDEQKELQALVRRRDDLRALAATEKARLDAALLTPAARKSVTGVVKFRRGRRGRFVDVVEQAG